MDRYLLISDGVWVAWGVSWIIAAVWSNRTANRPKGAAEAIYRIVTMGGGVLMFAHAQHQGRWAPGPGLSDLLIGVQVAGFAFCWWARLHLGRLWSSSVTRKEGHHVVDTGPYGLVRHPIYTGVDAAGIGLALLSGRLQVWVGAVFFILGFWLKARLEERFLREELGAEAYDAYAARVPMLVPFWPK